ncbi:hypothetical protein CUD01_16260 [Cellulomonas uda]|uniref:Uncharacterized protein n=1 Tax=Cellulomonas uda TaxID=1714 RepID=A0A4Y3KB71_CELUD|nr:hypothetical protein CUD01_16260 [Cellulomonas uda]
MSGTSDSSNGTEYVPSPASVDVYDGCGTQVLSSPSAASADVVTNAVLTSAPVTAAASSPLPRVW